MVGLAWILELLDWPREVSLIPYNPSVGAHLFRCVIDPGVASGFQLWSSSLREE